MNMKSRSVSAKRLGGAGASPPFRTERERVGHPRFSDRLFQGWATRLKTLNPATPLREGKNVTPVRRDRHTAG
jgi:hypothetical protein